MKNLITISFLVFISTISCKSEEQKRKEYLQSDAYKQLQLELQRNQELIEEAKYRIFLRNLEPIQDSIRKLNNQLKAEGILYSQEKILAIKIKIAQLEELISSNKLGYTANKIANSMSGDTTSYEIRYFVPENK